MKNKPFFKNWEQATQELADVFVLKYFGRDVSTYWISDEIGSVYSVADYFFSVLEMTDYLRYNYTRKAMFQNYEYRLECAEKGETPINIKNWRQLVGLK
jgi:hypothetical protein